MRIILEAYLRPVPFSTPGQPSAPPMLNCGVRLGEALSWQGGSTLEYLVYCTELQRSQGRWIGERSPLFSMDGALVSASLRNSEVTFDDGHDLARAILVIGRASRIWRRTGALISSKATDIIRKQIEPYFPKGSELKACYALEELVELFNGDD